MIKANGAGFTQREGVKKWWKECFPEQCSSTLPPTEWETCTVKKSFSIDISALYELSGFFFTILELICCGEWVFWGYLGNELIERWKRTRLEISWDFSHTVVTTWTIILHRNMRIIFLFQTSLIMRFHKYKTIHKCIQLRCYYSIFGMNFGYRLWEIYLATREFRVTDMQVLISSFMVRRQRAIPDILSSLEKRENLDSLSLV